MLSLGHHRGLLPRCPQAWEASRVMEKGPAQAGTSVRGQAPGQLFPDWTPALHAQSTEPAGDPPENRKDVLPVTTGLRFLGVPTGAFP